MAALLFYAEPTGIGAIKTWIVRDGIKENLNTIPMPVARALAGQWQAFPDMYGLTKEEVDHIHSAMMLENQFIKSTEYFG